MKRLIGMVVLTLLASGTALAVTGAAQAAPVPARSAAACQSLVWTTNYSPPPYATYIPELRIHRHGHFVTSQSCNGTFSFWSLGLPFVDSACVDVRVVTYNSRHRFDWQTAWAMVCGNGVPAAWAIPRGKEISFDTRAHSSEQRNRQNYARYNLVSF